MESRVLRTIVGIAVVIVALMLIIKLIGFLVGLLLYVFSGLITIAVLAVLVYAGFFVLRGGGPSSRSKPAAD